MELWDFDVNFLNSNYNKNSYEMLCGIPPFYNDNVDKMYELIKAVDFKYPSKRVKFSEEAQDLINLVSYIISYY